MSDAYEAYLLLNGARVREIPGRAFGKEVSELLYQFDDGSELIIHPDGSVTQEKDKRGEQ